MNYLVWEMETGTLGTKHIQGYCRFKKRLRMNQVSAIFPRAHLSLCRGTEEQNREYCSKSRAEAGEDWGEHGDFQAEEGQRGRRTDLTKALQDVKEKGIRQAALDNPEAYVKYHGGMEKYAQQLFGMPPLRRPMETTVIWGPPGIGKTWMVMDKFPDAYFVKAGRDPFGSYENQKVIVFDEFHPDQWNIQLMNGWLDIYRCRLDCRYQDKWAWWERAIIISNLDPMTWYFAWQEDIRQAFFRRIQSCHHMTTRDQQIFNQEI